MTRASSVATFDPLALIRAARQAMPFADRVAPGFQEPHARMAFPAMAGGALPLSATIAGVIEGNGRATAAPGRDRRAGEIVTLRDEIRRQSRVLAAGARLLELPASQTPEAAAQVGIPATQRTVVGLQVVKPAPFEVQGIEDAELTQRALGDVLAVDRGNLSEDIATHGFRIALDRSDFWAQPEEELAAAVMAAIATGAAQALDAVLIEALLAAVPADATGAFSLGKAAAAGLRFDELRGLVGTAAAGAEVNDAGALRALGVPAELTAATSETLIASWARFGVLVQPEAQVLIKRTSAAGAVEMTAWWGIGALVPSGAYAWRGVA